jgi:ribosomal protein S18 acetylase RimI-like enzyme
MASSEGLEHRSLLPGDIPAAYALSVEAGWNQTQSDWSLMLDHGQGFGVSREGRLVATALAHGFGQIGWISMVLVARDHRRRGLASKLLRQCIQALQDQGITPGLDATEAGRTVYEPLGFQAIYPLHRRTAAVRPSSPPPPGTVRRAEESDLAAIARHDRAAFGADRAHVLRQLLQRAPELAFVAEANRTVCGFVFGRDGREATQIGPLMADNASVALELVDAALARASGSVYIDSLDRHGELNDHLAARGFVIQRGFTRMLLGRSNPFDDPSRTFAIAGPELA